MGYYPFLPWFAILLLGYCLGEWFRKDFDPTLRKKCLLATGACAILLFLVLRYFNVYGDPAPWAQQKNGLYTLLSFLNVTKYPPSLLYTLATLGPVLMVLPLLEKVQGAAARPFAVIGQVPLFYYILHFYLLHAGALFLYTLRSGHTLNEIDFHINATFGRIPCRHRICPCLVLCGSDHCCDYSLSGVRMVLSLQAHAYSLVVKLPLERGALAQHMSMYSTVNLPLL